MWYKIKFLSFESWKTRWMMHKYLRWIIAQANSTQGHWLIPYMIRFPLQKQMASKYHFINYTSNWWEVGVNSLIQVIEWASSRNHCMSIWCARALIVVRGCLEFLCHLIGKFCWNRLNQAALKVYVQWNINQVHFLYI